MWCFIAIFVVFVEKHRRDEWSALSQEQIGIKEVSFVPQTQFDVTRVHNVHAVVAKTKRVGDGAYAHVFFVRRLAAAVVAVASSPNPRATHACSHSRSSGRKQRAVRKSKVPSR